MKRNRNGDRKRLSALAVLALVLSGLAGCVATTPDEDVVVLPFAALGVVSFKPGRALETPPPAQVNAQVARLLDAREEAPGQEMVAAR
jgi:predicted small lipoprotein YifL